MTTPQYVSVKKAAEILGFNERKVLNMIHTSELRASKSSARTSPWRISLKAIEEWAADHENRAA